MITEQLLQPQQFPLWFILRRNRLDFIKHIYRTYGSSVWGEYGFKDAFNPTQNWFANSYLAIDQGPIIVMMENYRSGLLWDTFMANPEMQPMLNCNWICT